MPVSKDDFRRAMGSFATGVTVVTSKGDDGRLWGVTVNAFSSVSLEPPLALICLENRIAICHHLKTCDHYAVNILAADQEALSNQFASRINDRFAGVPHALGETGSPLLNGALAAVECRIVHRYDGGDHTIFVAEVVATRVGDAAPLAYFRGAYRQIT